LTKPEIKTQLACEDIKEGEIQLGENLSNG
jgi:hypothetical protein